MIIFRNPYLTDGRLLSSMELWGLNHIREVMVIAIEQIETVIGRLTHDKAFRVKYCQDPDATLEAYLTPEEIRAIKTGDGHRLGQLGGDLKWADLTAALCGPNPGP